MFFDNDDERWKLLEDWLYGDKTAPIPELKPHFVKTPKRIHVKYNYRDKNHYDDIQMIYKPARAEVSKIYELPNTWKDFEEWKKDQLESFRPTKKSKRKHLNQKIDDMELEWSESREYIDIKARLFLRDSVVALKYVLVGNIDDNKGRFVCKFPDSHELVPVTRAAPMCSNST